MASCELKKVPKAVADLKQLYDLNLHRLNMAMCGFKHYPRVVSQLSSLNVLILRVNYNMKVLDKSLCMLQNLQVLNVS